MEQLIPAESDQELMIQLQGLCHGLLFPSESDYPFDVQMLKSGDDEAQPEIMHASHKRKASLEELFGFIMKPQSWHNEEDRKLAERYAALYHFLRAAGPAEVYKTGARRTDIYIFVHLPGGNRMLLHTTAIET